MKHLLFPIIALCVATAAFAQPAPAYVLFNSSCMQQLEYKYTRTGVTLYAYSVQPNADEQYLFLSGSNSMPTAELPVGTFDCSNLRLNDEVVKIINEQSNTRQLYIILQQPNKDYLMMPIYAAMQIKRYGPWYLLVAPKYTFAIDTTKLSYQDNLQGETSPTIIRFAGSQLANCRYQWRFHGEPARGNTEKMDFEFIYGVGLVSNRIGSTAAELEQSEVRLSSINGVPLDRYLTSICPYTETVNNNTTPAWTNPPYYGTAEKDKENSSAGYYNANPNGGNPGYNNAANPYGCPTPPGKGYHVVQKGESLKAIARTYKVDLKALINWNNISDPDHIEICQQIWLQKPPTTARSVDAVQPTAKPKVNANGPTVQDQSVYWNGSAPNNSVTPTQYYSPTPATVSNQHIVQKGESIYSISKRYVCAEECIRRANNMPLTGNIPLQIGQRLVIPDCSCQTPAGTTAPRTSNNYSAPPPQVSNILNTQTNYPPTQQQQDSPVEYGNYGNPAANNNTANPATNNNNFSNPAQNTQDVPPTQEYIVRQGETMNSIAIKFKMNLAELSSLNNIPQDEKLVAGRRLVVRKY